MTDATFEWSDVEQTVMVVRQNSHSSWSIDDQLAFMDDLLDTIMRRRQPTIIIVVCAPDNTPIANYMTLINSLRHRQLDNIKGAVFVKATIYLRTFVDLAQRLKVSAAKELHYVESLQEALLIADRVLVKFSNANK